MSSSGQDIDPAAALAALAAARWFLMPDRGARPMAADLADQPLLANVLVRDDAGNVIGVDPTSLMALIGASLSAVNANLAAQLAALAPLQKVAQSLPAITAHSDEVHDALYQGQQANGAAAAAAQATADGLKASLAGITQTAATALAQAATAQAAAAEASAQVTSLQTQLTALAGRVAALEARKVRLYRATGNLPTLSLNLTTSVMCPWPTDAVPNPLPTPEQCTVIQVAGSSAKLAPTAVSVFGVTVSVTAVSTLLPISNALQVVAATW